MTDYKCHGAAHRHAKLTEEKVKLILADPDKSAATFAEELSVHPITIRRVRARANWKHVPAPASARD
jgi:hypothetical protein